MKLVFKRDFTHKYLALIFLVFCFILLLSTDVFAFSFTYNNEDLSNDTFDFTNYQYIAIGLNKNNSNFVIFQSQSPLSFNLDSSSYVRTHGGVSDGYYHFSMPVSSFSTYDFSNNSSNYYNSAMGSALYNYNFIYSNYDIYNNSGDLVFQAPPQQVEETTILVEKVDKQEMDKTLQEIIQILPVILIILVGLIAIRKAILWIITLIRQA